MSDSPIPAPRRRLASSSGALAAVRPGDLVKAVDALQTDVDRLGTIVKIHTSRLDDESQERESLAARLEKQIEKLGELVTNLRAEVADLNLNLARAEGQASALKWAVTLIPTVISVGSLLWAVFGRK